MKEKEQAAAAPVDLNQFASAIGAAVAQGIRETSPKEIKEGDPEYVERLKREGFYDDFDKPVFQNSYQAQARGESEQTRYRATRLQTGTYKIGRTDKTNVSVHNADQGVWLTYPIKGDQMLRNQARWHSFEDLINQLWEAGAAPSVEVVHA